MTTYTVYNNRIAVFTTTSWDAAIEYFGREIKNYPIARVWIEDSNGATYN